MRFDAKAAKSTNRTAARGIGSVRFDSVRFDSMSSCWFHENEMQMRTIHTIHTHTRRCSAMQCATSNDGIAPKPSAPHDPRTRFGAPTHMVRHRYKFLHTYNVPYIT
mmetsp:Transcript_21842/g.47515  ORF Transcript_21842/g.47515 Transcript_21842/m.47515 type:complete len:107 (-) Transcript_21842:31-351(-)